MTTSFSLPIETHAERLAELLDLAQTRQLLESLAPLLRVDLALEDERGQPLIEISTPSPAPTAAAPARVPGATVILQREEPRSSRRVPIVDAANGDQLGCLVARSAGAQPAGSLRALAFLAATIGQIASREREARHRLAELTTIYNTSMMLAEARDLDAVLRRTVRLVSEVIGVKGASIRLIDETRDELRFVAVHGLSDAYLGSAPMRLSRAAIDHAALQQGHEQVYDLRGDPRVQFPEILAAEGIVSLLSVPMRYKGQAIGVLRAYTTEPRHFGPTDINLVRAVASQAAAAIANTRLAEERAQAEALEQQVRIAADVQQRMIPPHPPQCPGLEFASIYVPCYDLAGDLYDFVQLGEDRVGVVVADVAGKGVPASLIMATVRAYLRASAERPEELPETIGRLNRMLCQDNRPGEFVSLFYGVFDGPGRTLEYVLAGHIPPLLLREGKVSALESAGDTVLGVLRDTQFRSQRLELKQGDRLLLYTDGLDEARNFQVEFYGNDRVRQSFAQPAGTAEEMVQNVIWDMRRFVGLQRRSDDVTVIAVRVL